MFIVDASIRCNFEGRPEGPCLYCYNTSLRRKLQAEETTDIKAIGDTLRKEYPKRKGQIILHGGEPLFMKEENLDKLLKLSFNLSGQSSIQTNGTLISNEKIKLFKKYKTHVGVSVDGYWPANRWRGKSKKNTDLVIKNIFKLKKAGVPVAVLITLHKDNTAPDKIKYIENLILDLAEGGISSKVNLIYHPDSKIEIPARQAKLILLRLAEFVLQHNLSGIRPFQSIVDGLLGRGNECMFRDCDPFCTYATHVTASGVPSLCGRFEREVFYRENFPTSLRWEILKQTDCKGCRYGEKVCFGGCPAVARDWDWRNKDRFCEVYYALFEFFEKKIKTLLPFVPLKTELEFKPLFAGNKRIIDSRQGSTNSRPNMIEAETPSFPRMVWKENYQNNAQILQRWAEEFNRAELLTVINKLRDCGVYSVDAAKYQEECLKFNKKGLILLSISSPSGKSSLIQCAVSYSEDKAQELAECLQFGGENCVARIGKLLGYPSCCIDFMDKYSKTKKAIDPIFIAAKNTKGAVISKGKGKDGKGVLQKAVKAETIFADVAPESNIIIRDFGIKTIPHIPCSFNCEKSREFSKKFLQFMPSKNSLLKFLSEPMTWDEYKGVAVVNTKWFRGATRSVFHNDNIHNAVNLND